MFKIKYNLEDSIEYIPDYANNRELAESWDGEGDRPFFWVEILPLSGRDFNKTKNKIFKGKTKDVLRSAELLVKRIMEEYVPVVGGLQLEPADGIVIRPANGGELFDAVTSGFSALSEIVDDVYFAIQDASRASEGDLKKLRPRSDGCEQQTTSTLPQKNGDAVSVTQDTSNATTSRQKLSYESQETVTE